MSRNSEKEMPPKARERQNSIFERFLSASPFATASEQASKNTEAEKATKNNAIPNPESHIKDLSSRSMSIGSSGSITSGQLGGFYNSEDYIAPVLDSSAEILNDPNTDFRDVTVIYCDCKEDEGPCDNHGMRARSRSVLCNKLMRALEESPTETSTSKEHTMNQVPEDGKTIKFYSFAETLDSEIQEDKFRARKMSDLIC